MRALAQLLNDLLAEGIISNYALFGAMAQMRYTEAVATFDADVLVALPDEAGLDLLRPIYTYCERKGFVAKGEAIHVGEWPVQFIPAFDRLTREAMQRAETVDYEGIRLRVVSPNDLAAIALSVGRAKDYLRVQALFESRAADRGAVERLVVEYGLAKSWQRFMDRLDES